MFVTARVHPGETPASFMCQGSFVPLPQLFTAAGLLDFLTGDLSQAVELRSRIIFKASTAGDGSQQHMPGRLCQCSTRTGCTTATTGACMLPCSVATTCGSTGLAGQDLNRCWARPQAAAHPSIKVDLLARLACHHPPQATKAYLLKLIDVCGCGVCGGDSDAGPRHGA